jgi:hypothetical protein
MKRMVILNEAVGGAEGSCTADSSERFVTPFSMTWIALERHEISELHTS